MMSKPAGTDLAWAKQFRDWFFTLSAAFAA